MLAQPGLAHLIHRPYVQMFLSDMAPPRPTGPHALLRVVAGIGERFRAS